jgi:hypothetical protein
MREQALSVLPGGNAHNLGSLLAPRRHRQGQSGGNSPEVPNVLVYTARGVSE